MADRSFNSTVEAQEVSSEVGEDKPTPPPDESVNVEDSKRKHKDEFVIGIVAPIGADIAAFEQLIGECLSEYGYKPNIVKLSDFLKDPILNSVGIEIDESSLSNRYNSLMSAGNRIREITRQNDFLAKYAVTSIAESRPVDEKNEPLPLEGVVHVLHSLKHKDEVKTLREVYGLGFWLIGLYCHETQRNMRLSMKGAKPEEAAWLIQRDQDEHSNNGQQTRKVFELSDVFIHLNTDNLQETRKQLERFLDLVFGNPFRTPTPDEHAMFLAYAESSRSGSLARQIGAVITSSEGEVIATGTNDVPCFGGGLYWPGDSDQRDFARGFDFNTQQRDRMIESLMRNVIKNQHEEDKEEGDKSGAKKAYTEQDYLREGKRVFADSPLFDLTEFGRDVHAEMEALLCCARIGVSARNGTLYSTTFPCHNCAKHIVATGIKRVVFVEPYPKSKARELLSDSIVIESDSHIEDKVSFEHFVGVGPRRYFDLFSMTLGTGLPSERKTDDGKKIEWRRGDAAPRIPMRPLSYQDREKLNSRNFNNFREEKMDHGGQRNVSGTE